MLRRPFHHRDHAMMERDAALAERDMLLSERRVAGQACCMSWVRHRPIEVTGGSIGVSGAIRSDTNDEFLVRHIERRARRRLGSPLCQKSCRLDRIGTFGGADIRKWLDTDKRTKIG
jgi:hypothetical protein